MASAQQKPKTKASDKRNPDRRNGKAFGKNHHNMTPKPTGRTVMGYKRRLVEIWASSSNRTFAEQVDFMKEERRKKRWSAANTRRNAVGAALRCKQRCCNPA